jgi:hypothetical protein
MGGYRRTGVTADIPDIVADDEPLHRRIHPTFIQENGTISSQAFRDGEMSTDRGRYWSVDDTLRGYEGYGVAALFARTARDFDQKVISSKELLNPAHCLVIGKKGKGLARKLARAATWVKRLPS